MRKSTSNFRMSLTFFIDIFNTRKYYEHVATAHGARLGRPVKAVPSKDRTTTLAFYLPFQGPEPNDSTFHVISP
jgi:hypothetical protein